jgi:DNA (cytosine-5)-methyltransferase 1
MPFRAISLFSGCGGDTLGLERAGGAVVAFSEFNRAATQTHLRNFPQSVHLTDGGSSDITKLPDTVFAQYKGGVDVIFAGFPCQGVSKAGKKKATDPRNQMFRHFVRATKLIEPEYIIGENVPGLLSMKSGLADTDPLLFDVIRDEFGKIGYELTYKVLEATEVGVPQKRKRLFIVGWKRGDDMDASSLWASVASWGSSRVMPKLSSFIQPSLDTAHLLTEDTVPDGFDSYALNIESGAAVLTGTPHPFVVLKAGEKLLSCSKRVSPIHSEVISLEHPSKTIICTYDHQPRLLVGLKMDTGRYVRTLFPDEMKQIQGFPADFILCGNKKEQVVQVGNAVPPALVEAVARALFI